MAEKLLHELVHDASLSHGSKTAVTYDSSISTRVSLSYNDVISFANELTRHLRARIHIPDVSIGLFCSPDVFTPVCILGVLQFPASYVPLDPSSGAQIILRMMERCRMDFCLVQNDLLSLFQNAFSDLLCLEVCPAPAPLNVSLVKMQRETDTGAGAGADAEDVCAAVSNTVQQRSPLAYVLPTSGTTGHPKTVRVPHKCIVPNIIHLRSVFQMSADDVVFWSSPLTFDPSVVELFLALSSGSCLLIVPSAIKKMPRRLAHVLFTRNKTTVLQATPTLIRRFGRRVLQEEVLSPRSSLRLLALGGEPCPSLTLLQTWRQTGNRTSIYNLYGTTEVSCWASCYLLPDPPLCPAHTPDVPLGEPLLDTVMEVRDEAGRPVTEGDGQLFIGGGDRVCLLDGEEAAVRGTMRGTGDWVEVKGQHLFFLGRRDRLVKRLGQRVHLDTLQQVMESLPQVEVCAVSLSESSRLLAFIVPASASSSSSSSSDGLHDVEVSEEPAQRVMERQIHHRLSQLLPRHSIPDAMFFIPALPLTSHGKVDMAELMKVCEMKKSNTNQPSECRDAAALKLKIEALWKECLGLPQELRLAQDTHFLLSGGDSLQALRLYEEITGLMSRSPADLLEVILDGTFSDLLSCVLKDLQGDGAQKKRIHEPSIQEPSPKRQALTHVATVPTFVVVRRGGDVMDWGRVYKTPALTEASGSGSRPIRSLSRVSEDGQSDATKAPEGGNCGKVLVDLQVLWSSDTGRCVDASPVLLVAPERSTVFIGSHSHRLQALDMRNGELLWERVLGDRLESSAAVSKCGSLVAVGCYDRLVYFLEVSSGSTAWTFQTGDVVKSSPAVDPDTGWFFTGSHDGHVYALEPLGKVCKWRQFCGGGAVFSSPCVHSPTRRLYVATLVGNLQCLHPDTGVILWTFSSSAPLFSSPRCCDSSVFIGSVLGQIIALSHSGEKLWDFSTSGPVFSSPCVFAPPSLSPSPSSSSGLVTCGSHDGGVYCLDAGSGSLLWRFQTSGKVFSTPFVCDGTLWGVRALTSVCSTDGRVWLLDGETGALQGTLALPGPLFSSPVVSGRCLVVGCRNDYVYCLEMTRR